ncbi:hypothetical protein ACFWWC_45400 [Streptomyces sp. NPDC058642]
MPFVTSSDQTRLVLWSDHYNLDADGQLCGPMIDNIVVAPAS